MFEISFWNEDLIWHRENKIYIHDSNDLEWMIWRNVAPTSSRASGSRRIPHGPLTFAVPWSFEELTTAHPTTHHHVLARTLHLKYGHCKLVFCCILIQQFCLTINWFCSHFLFSSASRTSHTEVPRLSVEEWSYQHVWLDHQQHRLCSTSYSWHCSSSSWRHHQQNINWQAYSTIQPCLLYLVRIIMMKNDQCWMD